MLIHFLNGFGDFTRIRISVFRICDLARFRLRVSCVLRGVLGGAERRVKHSMSEVAQASLRAAALTPSMPPNPMVSTAEDGTMTIEPRSLIASYSMFIARRCRAVGLAS
jgi:hypothetical protein